MSFAMNAVRFLLFVLMFSALVSFAGEDTVQPDDIVGIWLIENEGQPSEKVEIYKRGDMYCGKIVWAKISDETGQPALDVKNKDDALKKRPLLGLEVMAGFKFDGTDSWDGGDFYAFPKGRTVTPKLTLVDGDQLKIQVKILFVKKSFVWKRV